LTAQGLIFEHQRNELAAGREKRMCDVGSLIAEHHEVVHFEKIAAGDTRNIGRGAGLLVHYSPFLRPPMGAVIGVAALLQIGAVTYIVCHP